MDSNLDSKPTVRLVDCPETPGFDLLSQEFEDSTAVVKLFEDEPDTYADTDTDGRLDSETPSIRLLPDNPGEQAVLLLRVQLLEAQLARQNAQIDFAERIDVDHLEWKLQKSKMAQLQVGNFLLIMLSLALMICAGCLVVIRL